MPSGVGVFVLPRLIVVGATKPTGDIHIPMFSVSASGYTLGDVFTLPMFSALGTAEVREARGIISLPIPSLTAASSYGVFGSGNIIVPKFIISTAGLGVQGSGSIVLPMFVVFDILPQHGLGSFLLPIPVYAGFGAMVPISKVYRGIVANLVNQAISTYSNYPFNSIAYFDGKYLGANEKGIYILDGDRDDGLDVLSRFKTGSMDFGESFIKHIRDVWLTFRTNGHLELTVFIDENQGITSTGQTVKVTDAIQEERIKVARGLRGRFFTVGLKNVSGADFDIDSLGILIDALRNRMR